MKEVKNDIIKKYEYKNYYIYIKETEESFEYYLQHKDYAVMYMMYGTDKEESTLKELLTICMYNIDNDIMFYKNEYEDLDRKIEELEV